MSLLSKIADRLILCPSTEPVDPGENRREVVFSSGSIEIEAWVSVLGDFESTTESERLVVLKFPGTGGRAERASVHPCELMIGTGEPSPFCAAEVWTLNHRGYGGSTGPPSIKNFVATIESFWDVIQSRFPLETKLAIGNSLGCVSVLYLSRNKSIDAILIRNPPPLAELIANRPRYNWWNFGMAKLVANEVPLELRSIPNARESNCPALLVTSEKDRMVPPDYQQNIAHAYAGEIRQFVIQGADHHHKIPEHQELEYIDSIDWLHQQLAN